MFFWDLLRGYLFTKKQTAMKHTLPVLTLTALAAAASAQVAPAAKQSLSYNRVVASWVNQNGSDISGISIFAQAKLGGGLYVSATVLDLETYSGGFAPFPISFDDSDASLGYAYTLPGILGVSTDLNIEVGYKRVGAGLRSLIGGGLEISLGYSHGYGSGNPGFGGSLYAGSDTFTVGASYNLGFMVKGLSINASYSSESDYSYRPGFDTTSIGVGYNF